MKKLLNKFEKIIYQNLNAKMQEAYNFQKASAVLADYGFVTNLLKYDWLGADFLAQHNSGDWLKIQLKGRLTVLPEYLKKDIYIMFNDKKHDCWYLYPHDEFMDFCKQEKPDKALAIKGFSRAVISPWQKAWLEQYRI
jgi:hypothetical protein